jgi:hypothetical protein
LNSEQVIRRVIDSLDELAFQYVLVGSFASNIYGQARSTKDADLVVEGAPGNAAILAKKLGPEFRLDPQIKFESVTGTRRVVIVHVPTQFEIEVFELSNDPHDQSRFARRRMAQVYGGHSWVLTPEDVLITKLNWLRSANRSKDRMDVQQVIAVQSQMLDWPYIERWCDAMGSRAVLEQIRTELRDGPG